MLIYLSFSQSENAPHPIAVTPEGMLIYIRFSQLANAPSPMVVTPAGIV
jgi:hypothetical protein